MNSEIISALLEWNPWLESTFPEALLGIAREYDITRYLVIPEIKILEGVRRSGKSTLLYQIAHKGVLNHKQVLYINFDDEILRKHSLSDIYYAYLEYGTIDYLLLDEIQHCNEWVPFIRKSYDRKIFEQIWITGSNSSLLNMEYAELLTGRNLKIKIQTLSFSEYLRFTGSDVIKLPTSREREAKAKQLFNQYVDIGAFPAIVLRPIFQRELLTNYFDDFIYKDIAKRHHVDSSKMRDLAIYLATHSAKNYSYRSIATTLKLHPNTVNEYISYLQEIFLFDELSKFDYSLKKQYTHDKKLYIVDTGLANAVSFRFSEDLGRMLETVVFGALKRFYSEIYFHKDKYECDFIIKERLEITAALQVTVSMQNSGTAEREFKGILEAMRVYKLKTGLILTENENEQREIDIEGIKCKIIIKPIWKWLLELDAQKRVLSQSGLI